MTSTVNRPPKPASQQAWLGRFALSIYRALLYLALPIVAVAAWRRCRKVRHPQLIAKLSPKACWLARFGVTPAQLPTGGIWVHAVSVGETRSIFPLLEHLHQQHPDLPITLTSGSTQGAVQALQFCPVPIYHQMIPYDYPFAVNKFLKCLRPKLVLMVETEIWPNLYHACTQQQIPLMLINARLKVGSFEAYQRWVKPLMQQALQHPQLIGAQFDTDRERFIALGAPEQRVKTLGNLKFDIQVPDQIQQDAQLWRQQLAHPERFVWVAASTHADEEALMIKAHQQLLKTHPDALLILVPRHADRFGEVAELLASNAQQLSWQQRSQNQDSPPDGSIYLADTMGELLLWFAVSNAAFIGGSMVNFGGHNILEPAALAKPVLSGPHYQNLTSLYDSFIADQGLQVCATPEALAQTLSQLANNPDQQTRWGQQALQALHNQTGSLAKHYHEIRRFLS